MAVGFTLPKDFVKDSTTPLWYKSCEWGWHVKKHPEFAYVVYGCMVCVYVFLTEPDTHTDFEWKKFSILEDTSHIPTWSLLSGFYIRSTYALCCFLQLVIPLTWTTRSSTNFSLRGQLYNNIWRPKSCSFSVPRKRCRQGRLFLRIQVFS